MNRKMLQNTKMANFIISKLLEYNKLEGVNLGFLKASYKPQVISPSIPNCCNNLFLHKSALAQFFYIAR